MFVIIKYALKDLQKKLAIRNVEMRNSKPIKCKFHWHVR